MSRALDQAKALNEVLDGMRRSASVMAFELKKIARLLREREAEGRVEPHWLDEMAREISVGPGAFVTIPRPAHINLLEIKGFR